MGNNDINYIHYVPAAKPRPEYPKKNKHILIDSLGKLKEALSNRADYMAFDTETTGLNPEAEDAFIVGFSFAFSSDTGYYVPVKHITGVSLGKEALDLLYQRILLSKNNFLANMRFDFRWMEFAGYDMSIVKYFDVLNAIWLSDTNKKMPSLKWAERHFLGWDPDTFEETLGDNYNFYYLDPTDAYAYACTDAEGTFGVAQKAIYYYKEAKLSGRLDNEFLYPLMKFEDNPLPIDVDLLNLYMEKAADQLKDLEYSIYRLIGYPIKINSNKQLGDALQELGINTNRYTKTGQMKVDIKTLESLEVEYAKKEQEVPKILDYIIKYSRLFKKMNSYILTLKNEAEKRNGRIRFSYLSNQVPTGRLASGADKKNEYFAKINVQSIPKPEPCMWYVHEYHGEELKPYDEVVLDWRFSLEDKSEWMIEGFSPDLNIRKAFIVEKDEYWVSCDYSGQELRIIANYTREPSWVNTFLTEGDLHKEMAVRMWGEENYDKEKRKRAKVLNFGMAYGMSGYSLSEKFHVSVEEGNDIVTKFWKAAPNIQRFQSACVRKAQKEGTIANYFGRPRRVKYWMNSDDYKQRAFGRRTINNTIIQSMGAEILKLAVLKLWKNFLNEPSWTPYSRFMNTVHDEANFGIKKDKTVEGIKVIQKDMEMQIKGWEVPINIGIEIGTSWGSTFPFHWEGEKLVPSVERNEHYEPEEIDISELVGIEI